MSRAFDTWYSLPSLDHLARLGETLEGDFAVAELTRLAGLLSSPNGTVNAQLSLRVRGGGSLELGLRCAADVELICQRCLEPVSCTLESSVRYEVVDADPAVTRDGDPGRVERLELNGGRLNPRQLIEEELIVAVPISPRHEDRAACGSLARRLEDLCIEDGVGAEAVSVDH